jgi:hypothetical protein
VVYEELNRGRLEEEVATAPSTRVGDEVPEFP